MLSVILMGPQSRMALGATPDQGLMDAQAAYRKGDVKSARAGFAEVLAAGQSRASVKSEAAVGLGRVHWLFDGQVEAAERVLRPQLATATPCASARLLGRVWNASGGSAQVIEKIAPLAPRCAFLEPGVGNQVVAAYLNLATASTGPDRARWLKAAHSAREKLPPLAQLSPEGARQGLMLGVLSQNAGMALAGWRDFFWLDANEATEMRPLFDNALRQGARADDIVALADLLVRNGFDREAVALGHLRGARPPATVQRWSRVDAYLDLRARILAASETHDQAIARGEADNGEAYKADIEAIFRQALIAIGGDTSDLWRGIDEAWNLAGVMGQSNGVSSLHLGHKVIARRDDVVQGRRTGVVQFVALDNMLANGFTGRLGDGEFGPGGWATSDTIVQVRERMTTVLTGRIPLMYDNAARDRAFAERDAHVRQDALTYDGSAIVFLKGLSETLRLEALTDLSATVPGGEVAGSVAWVRQARRRLWEETYGSSIVLHEGRHVLDQLEFTGDRKLSDAELEYRGKLSEIGGARRPRLALASIYTAQIGGTTGHGQANLRLIGEYVAWMKAHGAEVQGLDVAAPLLPQLYRLSDDQIRDIAKALDPEKGS